MRCRFLGYEKGGELTEMVRRRPYSVVLFDEVEKADSTVTNLFLQILDDGRLTDGQGRTVDFTNTIIILADVQRHFRPELINRFGEVVLFHPLSGEQLRKIARMQLKGLAARLADKGIGLDVTDAAIDVVLSRSSDQVQMYGARPIKRCLQKNIMTRISKMVVQEEVDDDCYVSVDADGEKKELVFTVEKPEPGMGPESSEVTHPSSIAEERDAIIVVLDEEEEAEATGETPCRD